MGPGAGIRVIPGEGVPRHVHTPGLVHVAGEHHQVADPLPLQVIEEPVAARRVAVPLIRVLGFPVGVQHGPHHHLLPEHRPADPRRPGGGELPVEPTLLPVPEERAVRVRHTLGVAPFRLPGASDQPGVQHDEVEQLPEAERPVGALARPGLRFPDGHPLEVGLHGRCPAHEPVALFVLHLVVLGAVGPGVVGDLVVVPDADERVEAVDLLEVGIGLVLGVADPVVGQGGDLLVGPYRPRRGEAGSVAVGAVRVLVEVVAEVEHRVQVVPLRDPPVDVEVAEGQVRAGDEREPHVVGIAGQGLRPAHRRPFPERLEPVVVGHAGFQAGSRDLEGVVPLRPGSVLAFGDHFLHSRVAGDLPADRDPVVGGPGDPGPEQHPVGEGIPARYPVAEDPALAEDGEGAGEGEGESGPGRGSEKEPAVHGHDRRVYGTSPARA